jgi:hypothetical protein
MPVSIGEIDSTVEVAPATHDDPGRHNGPTVPSSEATQQWLALAARAQELAARTAAWRFDD